LTDLAALRDWLDGFWDHALDAFHGGPGAPAAPQPK
jgi:hypothetical protein